MTVATRPHPRLLSAFSALNRAGARWALLRGADELSSPRGDVDLLVDPRHWTGARTSLGDAGFVWLPAPGHGPHRFLFGFDEGDDSWIKLDVVTSLAFGTHQELSAGWHDEVLARRLPDDSVWRLSPRDEDRLHLLHDLLDKEPARTDPAVLARLLQGDPAEADGLSPALSPLLTRLGAGEPPVACAHELRRSWPGTGARRPVRRAALTRLRRRLHGGRRWGLGGGLAVALLGPDGAGKSSLADGLAQTLPVHSVPVHMGLWQSTPRSRALSALPGGKTAVGLGRALTVSARARYQIGRGRLAVLDRSALDLELGDADRSAGGRVVAAVFAALAPTPSLVMVLDAPGTLMHARKGEHSPEVLERRRQDYLRLAQRLPASVVLDAGRSVDEVRRAATSALWAHLARRQVG